MRPIATERRVRRAVAAGGDKRTATYQESGETACAVSARSGRRLEPAGQASAGHAGCREDIAPRERDCAAEATLTERRRSWQEHPLQAPGHDRSAARERLSRMIRNNSAVRHNFGAKSG